MTDSRGFGLALRGYDRSQVDLACERADTAVNSNDPALRSAVRDELRAVRFSVVLRGYARPEVDSFLQELAEKLDQPPA